jgi:uncharacterized protein YndB with AHSA1/START domain
VRYYEATSTISAPPDKVWQVLADGAHWADWDSGVDEVDGRIALHEKIKIRSAAAPGRVFPVKVTTVEQPRLLRFSGGIPLGLFRGVRTYVVTPADDGSTVFRVREEYSGPLLGMIWRSMPHLGASFARFANGLKARVEAGA